MNITLSENDSIVRMKVNGQINLYNVTEMKEIFQKELDKGFRFFMIDMKLVNYVDSSGVGAFILQLNSLKKIDGKLALFNIDDTVRIVFAMTKLNNFFQIFDSEKEAENYLKA
jgi:anti-sigma B factor antagonist